MNVALVASLALWLIPADSVQNPDTSIKSIAIVGSEVLAATQDGVFLANQRDRQWRKLNFPDNSGAPVMFAERQEAEKTVYAYLPRVHVVPSFGRNPTPRVIEPKRPGLYRSSNTGQNWEFVGDSLGNCHGLFHFGNTLYALAGDPKGERNSLLLASQDRGRIWRDVLGQPMPAGTYTILPDPDHPGLVCLRSNGGRALLFQAEDSSYKLKTYMAPNWLADHRGADRLRLEEQMAVTLGAFYTVQATLGNYFKHDFGAATSLPGLQLSTRESKLTFAKGSEMPVKVNILFRSPGRATFVLDNAANADFWCIAIVKPDGTEVRIAPRVPRELDWGHLSGEKRLQAAIDYREKHDLTLNTLREGESYLKTLDLGKMADFSQLGTYQVRLAYDCSWARVADKFEPAAINEFTGWIFSKPFALTVTAK